MQWQKQTSMIIKMILACFVCIVCRYVRICTYMYISKASCNYHIVNKYIYIRRVQLLQTEGCVRVMLRMQYIAGPLREVRPRSCLDFGEQSATPMMWSKLLRSCLPKIYRGGPAQYNSWLFCFFKNKSPFRFMFNERSNLYIFCIGNIEISICFMIYLIILNLCCCYTK